MNVAFIPVRGASKSIPLKNIRQMAGQPLVYWTAKAACGCERIDKVYIATDSGKIKSTAAAFLEGPDGAIFQKLEVIGRSAASASDTASTESAMLEFASQHDFENMILIQATSPLLTTEDINRGLDVFADDDTDSVLSVVRQKRFVWKENSNGFAEPVNYVPSARPRRQEFDGYLVENGAYYITSRQNLLKSRNRISGKIRAVEMPQDSYFEIDEPDDWTVVECLMKKNKGRKSNWNQKLLANAAGVKLFLTDCDGCLTDGRMYYSETGDESKKFHTRDGMGFQMLRERGILTGILTGENLQLHRADKLQLDILRTGCTDKAAALHQICLEYNILPQQVVYIGDDLNDLEAIKFAGIGCCPADAVFKVREEADIVTAAKGGQGVIREVADLHRHLQNCSRNYRCCR